MKFKKFLLTGDWHVHTCYTDGKNTISEYVKKAEENKLDLIAFTEHVRRTMSYRFEDFISDVYSAKDKSDIEILAGCEAKVLDSNGTLDVTEDILKECDIVLGAFHEFRSNQKEDYLEALKNMLKNKYADIWAHPTLFAKKNDITLKKTEIIEIVKLCIENNILLEKNFKYEVPDDLFLKIAFEMGCEVVYGSDAHNIDDLLNNFKKNSNIIYFN